jgi:hypothetical protein
MRKIIICISTLVCVVLLFGASLTDSYAGTSNEIATKRMDPKNAPKDAKDTVAISGTVSGSLQGRIRASGREVMITKRTKIYKNGMGMIDQGTFLSKAPVYIIGVVRDGVVYAQFVIVSDEKKTDKGGSVRRLSPDEPL